MATDARTTAFVEQALALNRVYLLPREIKAVAEQFARLVKTYTLVGSFDIPDDIDTPLEFRP